MIKYRVLVKQNNNNYINYGIIQGYNKIDLAIQLNALKKEHNIKTEDIIKLQPIEFDIEENL